jgi:hypothetical protein
VEAASSSREHHRTMSTVRTPEVSDVAATGRWTLADLGLAVALVVCAFVVRLDAFPVDGLFYDDAWAVASITLASPTEWLRVSVEHPAYNVLLLPLRPLARENPTVLVWPALIAASLLPAMVFGFLRASESRRGTAAALAACVVAAPTAVAMSAHVKTYPLDAIIVAVIATLLPRLTRRRWDMRFAAAWLIGACLLSALSVFALLATAVAAVVLLAHARDEDRTTRLRVVVAQAVLQGAYLLVVTRLYDPDGIESFWRMRGGYVERTANPLRLVANLWEHFRNLVGAYPGSNGSLLTALAIAALVGLVVGAMRPGNVTGRFLVMLVMVAAVGSLLGLLPFGVAGSPYGRRLSVWLIPVLAYGLAEVARLGASAARKRPPLPTVLDVTMYALAAVVIFTAVGKAPGYGNDGYASATEYIEQRRGPDDLVLLLRRSAYSYAIEAKEGVDLVPDRTTSVGSRIVFGDHAFAHEGGEVSPEFVRELEGKQRVFVFTSPNVLTMARDPVLTLAVSGFEPGAVRRFDDVEVTTWTRATE